MDFSLTEDQQALKEGVRSFCEDRFSFERIGELEAEPLDRARWAELADLGVFSLCLPEAQGGVALGMAEASLVFSELARRLAPGPLIASHLAAPLIPEAASGACMVGSVDLAAAPEAPALLDYGAGLDALLLLREDGVYRCDGPFEGESVAEPLDPLTPVLRLPCWPQGERMGDAACSAALRQKGALLCAASLLGIAERTLEYAVEYARGREQFGRPIAGFQSIKHLAADMYARAELARAGTLAAGVTLDQPQVGDPERAVASARVVAGEAAFLNARACVQIYGGMGFTWEMPPHYYLKRCLVLENSFGAGYRYQQAVAERVEL